MVKFEARLINHPEFAWKPVSETFVRSHLRTEPPDPETLDGILDDMQRHGSEADNGVYSFRAVTTINESDYRIAYTTAEAVYDGCKTIELSPSAGYDNRGRMLRKVGIKSEAWTWQTNRYWSGLHSCADQEEAGRFPQIYKINPDQ